MKGMIWKCDKCGYDPSLLANFNYNYIVVKAEGF